MPKCKPTKVTLKDNATEKKIKKKINYIIVENKPWQVCSAAKRTRDSSVWAQRINVLEHRIPRHPFPAVLTSKKQQQQQQK